jgi:hypothetical protein
MMSAASGKDDRSGRRPDRARRPGRGQVARPAGRPAAGRAGRRDGPEARGQFAVFDPGKSLAASAARLACWSRPAAAGRQGEAALLALSIAADAGAAGPTPVDRARLARALLTRRAWTSDARAVVVEGLLALTLK